MGSCSSGSSEPCAAGPVAAPPAGQPADPAPALQAKHGSARGAAAASQRSITAPRQHAPDEPPPRPTRRAERSWGGPARRGAGGREAASPSAANTSCPAQRLAPCWTVAPSDGRVHGKETPPAHLCCGSRSGELHGAPRCVAREGARPVQRAQRFRTRPGSGIGRAKRDPRVPAGHRGLGDACCQRHLDCEKRPCVRRDGATQCGSFADSGQRCEQRVRGRESDRLVWWVLQASARLRRVCSAQACTCKRKQALR